MITRDKSTTFAWIRMMAMVPAIMALVVNRINADETVRPIKAGHAFIRIKVPEGAKVALLIKPGEEMLFPVEKGLVEFETTKSLEIGKPGYAFPIIPSPSRDHGFSDQPFRHDR